MRSHSSVLWLIWHFSFLFFSCLPQFKGLLSPYPMSDRDTAGLSPTPWSAPAEFPAWVLQQILSPHLRCLCKYGWVRECMGSTPGSLSTDFCEHSHSPFSLLTNLARSLFRVLPSSLVVSAIHEICDSRIQTIQELYMELRLELSLLWDNHIEWLALFTIDQWVRSFLSRYISSTVPEVLVFFRGVFAWWKNINRLFVINRILQQPINPILCCSKKVLSAPLTIKQ